MNVICVPTVRDFVNELLRQYNSTDARYITVFLQESVREIGGAPFPRYRLSVRLTAEQGQGTEDVILWFWESAAVSFPDEEPCWKAYIQVMPLIREALEMAGFLPSYIRPGAIAASRDLDLVRGSTEGVLLWEKGDNGTLTVRLDPAWPWSGEAGAAACYEWSLNEA